ncbi:MAG TPA: glycosyltransferase [Thermopetrobacter sp.]|nr:glycosyltransferase [Thermopetrobacter sp.]
MPRPDDVKMSQPPQTAPYLSLVVPFHNEERGIDVFFSRIDKALADITGDYEIICVDDGSTDGTLPALKRRAAQDPRIRIISLSRNFGKDIALTAGLDHATGEAVIPMDADLQDPPELIGALVEKWRQGHDVVFATRVSRRADGLAKRVTARLFYRFHNRIADLPIPHDTGDFRLMDRRVVEALRSVRDKTRFMKGLFTWVGFRQASVEYVRPERATGETKWSFWQLWNFAIDGLTSNSTLPLRIWTYLGFVIFLFAFGFAAWIVIRTLIYGVDVPGYASMMVVVLLLGGINIVATGILGEYIARIFNEVRQRPLYLIRERHGFSEPATPRDDLPSE